MAEYRSTGRELRKSPGGLIAGLLTVLLIVGAVYGVKHVADGMESLITEPADSEVELEVPEVSEETSAVEEAPKYGRVRFPESKVHRGPLVLVNGDYPIENAESGVVSVFEQRNEYLAVRDLEVYLLDEPMLALNEMAAAFYEETGLSDLLVKNGYITRETQQLYYQMGGAMPGCNEFESGYTFELSLLQNGMFADFTDADAHKWIPEHCAEFGFVQRYPEGKSEITGVTDQPWVFRYVGTPHAWYMYRNDLCLEEYIELLDAHPIDGAHFRLYDQEHRAFEIYYVPVDPDPEEPEVEVLVPFDYQYTISGNNKHGFYITLSLGDDAPALSEEE